MSETEPQKQEVKTAEKIEDLYPIPLDYLADNKKLFAFLWSEPTHYGLTAPEIALKCSISRATVFNWAREPEIMTMVDQLRQEHMAMHRPKVDVSVLRAAEEGKEWACKLYYERWDKWTPKGQGVQVNTQVNVEGNGPVKITQEDGAK